MSGGAPSTPPPPSRNSLFFETAVTPSPPSAKRQLYGSVSPRTPPPPAAAARARARGHAKKPSFGHASREELEREQARIRASRGVRLRLILEREFRIGRGRDADIYFAAYAAPDAPWQLCAVKRIFPDRAANLAGLSEVYALRRFSEHPGIVRLIGVQDEMCVQHSHAVWHDGAAQIENPPRLLILLEYMPYTLNTYVRRFPQAVDLRQWHAWALELASTLAWLHSHGCVHGDIKTSNVLLDDARHTRICDFSTVLFVNAPVPATDVYEIGTPAFRAPELCERSAWLPGADADGHPALSYTLDVFSLGVLLYTLATGEEPSERGSAMELRRRQAHFFSTEEQERLQRLEVGRGDMSPMRVTAPVLHTPDEDVLARLLDPAPEPSGVIPPSGPPSSPARNSLPLRTQSLREPRHLSRLARAGSERRPRAVDVFRENPLPDIDSLRLDDLRSYKDGLPALILPGGGRLPDVLRDMVEAMVHPVPEARPTASAVVATLSAHPV